LTMIMRARKETLPCTVLPTMFDKRTNASLMSLKQLEERYRNNLSSVLIPVDTMFRDASREGVPLPIKAPRSRGALAYGELVDELLIPTDMRQPAVA
ncbi:MAG: chromosome partitioning protein, partial [Halothiobacillaceae bacterium]